MWKGILLMPNDITIRFVVNGDDADVVVAPGTSLRSAMRAALLATCNTARPTADWEVRRETGVMLGEVEAPVDAIRELDLISHQGKVHVVGWLYLTLRLGAGGDCPCSHCPRTHDTGHGIQNAV